MRENTEQKNCKYGQFYTVAFNDDAINCYKPQETEVWKYALFDNDSQEHVFEDSKKVQIFPNTSISPHGKEEKLKRK